VERLGVWVGFKCKQFATCEPHGLHFAAVPSGHTAPLTLQPPSPRHQPPQRGYKMHDRILRAAEVGVYKAP